MARFNLAVAALLVLATAATIAEARYANIVEAAQKLGAKTVLAAAEASGLAGTLADNKLVATVFLPTDDAFAKALKALGITSQQLLADPGLTARILQYHVVAGRIARSGDFLTTAVALPTLLTGQAVSVYRAPRPANPSRNDFFVRGGSATNVAKIVKGDHNAGAAVVHLVDAVLLPSTLAATLKSPPPPKGKATPSPKKAPPPAKATPVGAIASVYDYLSAQRTGPLATLKAAVDAAGLADTLRNPNLAVTLLAPSNDGFKIALQFLGLTADQLLADVATAKAVLLAHVIPSGPIYASALVNGGQLTTLNSAVTLTSVEQGGTWLFASSKSSARVLTPNVVAGKSVIHIIDNVLLP